MIIKQSIKNLIQLSGTGEPIPWGLAVEKLHAMNIDFFTLIDPRGKEHDCIAQENTWCKIADIPHEVKEGWIFRKENNMNYWAEAKINGVLRGGLYNSENNTFTFHMGMERIVKQDAKKLPGFKILRKEE
jgi:hypothetical protein